MPIPLNMDGVALDGVPAATSAGWRDLLRLTTAALAFLAAVGAATQYAGVLLEANSEFSFTAPFQGWQLWAVEGALGLVVAAAVFFAFRWLRRTYRALAERTPHRRAIVMAAVLPGLFVGGTVGLPFEPLLGWASNHTATATAWRTHSMAERQAWLQSPTTTVNAKLAPWFLAEPLLRPADLGPGWYDTTRPNPVQNSLPATIARRGGVDQARVWLTQAQRSGGGWSIGLMLAENETRFDTREHAVQYLHAAVNDARCGCGDELGPVTHSRIHGVRVWRVTGAKTRAHHLWAGYAIGNRVYTVMVFSKEGQPSPRSTLLQPLPHAVTRALQSS